jgi:hypothetical protein
MTTWVTLMGFSGDALPGPAAISLFLRMGWMASLTVPLGFLAVGLVGHGMREQAAGYVFSAGLIVLALATGGHALGVTLAGEAIDLGVGVFILQRGVIAAALWALVWLWTGRWRDWRLLDIQIALAIIGNLALLIPALVGILGSITGLFFPEPQVGRLAGWLGLVFTLAASIWYLRLRAPAYAGNIWAASGVALCVLGACVAAHWDATGWLAYHVLTVGGTFLALLLLLFSWAGSSQPALGPVFWTAERRARAAALVKELFPPRLMRRWVEVLSGCVVLLALGGAWGDPVRPYWSSAATLAVSVLFGAMAVWVRRPVYVYVSGLLVTIVGFLVWQAWLVGRFDLRVWFAVGPGLFDRLILLEIFCLAASSTCWSLVELVLRRREPPVDLRADFIPYAHAAALLAVHLLAILVLIGVAGDLSPIEVYLGGPLTWIAWVSAGLALVVCLWDTEARALGLPLAPLYVIGLLAIGLTLHHLALPPRLLAWTSALPLAGFALAVSALLRFLPWTTLQRYLRLPARSNGWLTGWFLPAQILVACIVLGLSVWMCLDFTATGERLCGPLALLLIVVATVLLVKPWPELLARQDLGDRQYPVFAGLSLAVWTAVEATWAVLDPEIAAPWLHRNVLLLTVLVVAAALYRAVWARRLPQENHWTVCARRLAPALALLAAFVLMVVLIQEFLLFDPSPDVRRTPMAWPAVVLVGALFAGIIIGAIRIAVSPQHDPFGLSARGRVWCVWGAEVVLVLFVAHLRLNVPQLFRGFISAHWPFLVMVLGFLGVGLGELFARRGLPMLAEPLGRTGLFLPLLPLLAYLVRPLADFDALGEALPGVQPFLNFLNRLTHPYGVQSLMWFTVGLLYALTAVLRRASAFAIAAALFANFGLWVIYAHQENLRFILHPQIWLIPLGLILLAAEHLERDRLSPSQRQTVRYLGLLLIYVSSTADMFITGLGESVLLPVVLAVFSVAGVLAGILLRVRAFLFLGMSFLFLVVFSQIWFAAVNRAQTWVWWASGIVLGAAILALFALFEKRRNDVLKLIEEIKAWK